MGWLAGAIYWGGTCYWVYGVMHDYADLTAPAAAAIFAGVFPGQGAAPGRFLAAGRFSDAACRAVPAVAAAWVAVEGTHQYLGFTWLHLGNAGASMSVLARLAPFTGVYGLSFAFAHDEHGPGAGAAAPAAQATALAGGAAAALPAAGSAEPRKRATRRCVWCSPTSIPIC